MIPILYNSTETDFTKNGIGWLKDCIKCTVTEELNGSYECEFSYPITGQFYSEITPDKIIKVKANETSALQLFRVYRHTKPINGIVKIYCQHISYDLNGNTVTPFSISSKTSATTVLNSILEHCYYAHRFTAVSTSNTQSKFETKIPVSPRKCLGGMEGSILDNFKGEFEFDNFIIRHYSSRGQDNGVTIQYSKNLTDIKADTSIADTYTSVYPYATDEDGDYYELPEKVIELPSKSRYAEPRMLQLDLSDKFDSETRITAELLRKYANEYISNNKIDEIKQNLKVSFVQLWQTEEYKNIATLERVKLGDTVTVKYPELGVSVKSKVIKTVYDVLNEKYIEIELGQAKSNFASTLNKVNSELKTMSDFMRNQPSLMEKAIKSATDTITGQTGGYVVLNQDKDTGKNNEILIMNQPTIEAATQLWRWNLGGLGYASGTNAYNGPYRTAINMNGEIVADFITAGTLNADLIKAGTIEDLQHNTSIDMTNGNITMNWDLKSRFEINKHGLSLYGLGGVKLSSLKYDVLYGGIFSTTRLLVGDNDSEKVKISNTGDIFVTDGTVRLIDSDNNRKVSLHINPISSKGTVVTDVLTADSISTDIISIDGIAITKNSNNRLLIDVPVVSNFSIENSNGIEIGSFYGSQQGNSVLNVDIINVDNTISVDTIQPKTSGGKTNIPHLSSTIGLDIVDNNITVGSFYVNTNGKSFLKTDILKVGNYQYAEQNITIDGTTYRVLARA